MTIGRVVFVICVLLALWHFRDYLPIDRSSGQGVVDGPGRGTAPNTLRGTFLMQEEPGSPRYYLKFLDNTRVQMSSDGKVWGPEGTYNIFDDKLYLYQGREVWNMEIRGKTLYHIDRHWTFHFVGK